MAESVKFKDGRYLDAGDIYDINRKQTRHKNQKSNRDFYIAQAFNYLATICNLETPIEKTSEQTLRVIYTITDV